MEVEYIKHDKVEVESIASFLYDEILHKESYRLFSRDKIRLEDQPQKVIEAMGRLIEILLDKSILNLEDLKHITQVDGRKANTLRLKKGE